jgi:hypothetical protein
VNTIIGIVNDIASQRILFDSGKHVCVDLFQHILDGDYSDDMKRVARYFRRVAGDKSIEISDEDMARIAESSPVCDNLITSVQRSHSQLEVRPIGDRIEDMLNLIYERLDHNFHKIDMRFQTCCSLTDPSDGRGTQYKTATLTYIDEAVELNRLKIV